MSRFSIIGLVFLSFLTLPALPSKAGSVFEVAKIKVDASAASTTEARAEALRQGQREALSIALRRLVNEEEWDLLPDVTTLAFENLVEGFRVSNEKSAPGRYLATLSVQFKPEPLRNFLRGFGVAVTEAQSRPALLLPVLEDLQGLQAWGEHWWRQGWADYDIENNPAPLLLPLGDLEDTILANAEDILIGDPVKLQALNERYGTDTVVVVHALADVDGQLGVTAYIFGAVESDVIVKTYRLGGAHEDMGAMAIADITATLAERWKSIAAVASDEMQVLQVRANYADLAGWTAMLELVNEADLVRSVTIVELTGDYAFIDLAYVGSLEQLGDNLDQRGLWLTQSTDGAWGLAAAVQEAAQ